MAGTSQKKTSGKSSSQSGKKQTAGKKSGSGRKSTGTSSGRKTSKKTASKAAPAKESSFLGKEIAILVTFAVCVLLVLSNIGVCGALGKLLHQVQCGLFGLLGYLFPIALFVAVLFYASNRQDGKAMRKLAVSVGLFLVLCGLIGLITAGGFDSAKKLTEYFTSAAQTPGGGIVGGIFILALCSTIGVPGAYVVLIILCVIFLVLITERSVLQPIGRGSKKVYDSAREDVERLREEHEARAEEKRQYRRDQKISGVALDRTKLEEDRAGDGEEAPVVEVEIPMQELPAENQNSSKMKEAPRPPENPVQNEGTGAAGTNAARTAPAPPVTPVKPEDADQSEDVPPRPISITGLGFDTYEAEDESSSHTGTGEESEILTARRVVTTQQELENLDSLHDNIFANRTMDRIIWGEEKNGNGEAGQAGTRFTGGAAGGAPVQPDETCESAAEGQKVPDQADAGAPERLFSNSRDGWQDYAGKVPDSSAWGKGEAGQETVPVYDWGDGSSRRGHSSWREDFDPDEEGEALTEEDILTDTDASRDFGNGLNPGDYGQDEAFQGQEMRPGLPGDNGSGQGAAADFRIPDNPAPDIKRVETANGKIMEVEVDPDDDPLTRKRRENQVIRSGAETENGGTQTRTPAKEGATFVSGGTGSSRDALKTPGKVSLTGSADRRPDLDSPEAAFAPQGASAASTLSMQATAREAKAARPYVCPPCSLLTPGDKNARHASEQELWETAKKLEDTLRNFGVGVTVTNISCGPAVTQYELQPEQGVRVSRIVSLADDIKLNLAAADIRIEAPIPGKASVGIEVPNRENSTVHLRDLLESSEFKNFPSKLAFAVGLDISGKVIVADLAKMPHLLIAGATGSGKSVCINTMIMSILYKATPEEVRLILIDPKVVELSVYNKIPHLMIPVVTDPKQAAGALNWAVAEMTDRYRKFADLNVRDLKGYNEKLKAEAQAGETEEKPLPQILIVVDEMSDLMMVSPGEVEDAICRLAQMARAAGLHLVLATQRPSVNVITGLIKANVPSRIAFSVSSGVDSRTIIDMNGAEKLLGKGDMLFYPSGYQKPVRVQGAFVSDEEVSAVVDFVSQENESRTYDSAVAARLASMSAEGGSAGGGSSERDEHFAAAGRFVIEKQKGTIGMLQRVFKIGFNRAARIMDQLAEAGVVADDAGTKARDVLMDMNQFEELLKELGLQ